MAAELRELRSILAAIQKMFGEQQRSAAKGSEPAPEPLLTLSQWKALQETIKREWSLPATPVKKAGLFTAVCEKVGSSCGRPHKIAEVAWVDVPLLNGFVGVWWHRVTPSFRRRNEGLHSPE